MDIAKKLQLRPEHHLVVVGRPSSLTPTVPSPPSASNESEPALLVFVPDGGVLEEHREQIVASAMSNRLTWVAYPKGGQLGTDLNRDTLAATLTNSGLQPVRQIALDDVWSALRFRPGT